MTATRILLADLEQLAPERWCVADFARLASEPFAELERVAAFLGLEWNPDAIGDDPVPGPEEPAADADVARSEALQRVLPRTIGLAERARDLISQPLSPRPTATPDVELATAQQLHGRNGPAARRRGGVAVDEPRRRRPAGLRTPG